MTNTRKPAPRECRFSFLELVAATCILGIVMTFSLSLIGATKKTHLRAQQHTHAIMVLENVIEELESMHDIQVNDVRACLDREFDTADIRRKHELEAVVGEEEDGVQISIINTVKKRTLASVRLIYED
jgi:type II secretory pathway pseudopilin PulG